VKLTIDLNTAPFRAAAQDAVQKLGANAELLIKEEGRLFIHEYMKLTPPFASGGYGRSVGSQADLNAGRKAVQSDLSSVAQGANRSFLQFVVDTFGAVQIRQQLFKKGTDKPYLIDWDKVAFSIEELKRHHVSKRNRLGRTPSRKKGGGGMGEGDRTIGRWVARERLIVPYEVFGQYLNQLYEAIGSAKATFNAAALALGAKLPPWIRRHGPLGTYSESKEPTFSITLGGQSQVPDAQKAVNMAIAIRGKKLTAEIKRLMSAFAKTGKIPTRRRSFNQ
jgi:hypothetical protein